MKVFSVLLLTALPVMAFAGPTEELVKRLSAINTLSGSFEQVVLDQGGTRLQEASGDMQMARGNRFRWHTREPFEQIAVSDGKLVWIFDVDLEQVVEKPLTKDSASTPALLFGGDPASVAEAFVVSIGDRDGKAVTYHLVPRLDDSLFVQLEVTFIGDKPQSMRLEDALGQQTALDFHSTVVNGKLANDMFNFVAPVGVDVIRQSE